MYDDHYGLTGRPFQLTPDPGFWFDTATHRKAMAYLGYGLSQGEGFVVITGAPGVGKTTLMGHLLAEIDRERLNVIKIVSTQLRPEDLLRTVCTGLGIDASGLAKAEMLAEIEHGLHDTAREGRRTLLVMDEAQALPVESLEELRMLSNFQAGGYPLLQIFLLGQPEFRQTLNDPRLDQLRQRVIAMHHLGGMEPEEVESYLIHRLSCVGWRGKPRFTNDAIAAMYRWSSGVPRQLNQLAGRVLLYGSIEGIDSFSGRDVEAVIADLDEDSLASSAPGSVDRRRRPSIQALANGLERREPLRRRSEEAAPSVTPIQTDPAPAPTPGEGPNDSLDRRVHDLEIQLRQQDEALRRILTLLVDWVESDTGQRPDLSSLRGFAA